MKTKKAKIVIGSGEAEFQWSGRDANTFFFLTWPSTVATRPAVLPRLTLVQLPRRLITLPQARAVHVRKKKLGRVAVERMRKLLKKENR